MAGALYAGQFVEALWKKLGSLALQSLPAGTQVNVKLRGTSTNATLYTARDKASTQSQPITVDADGNVSGYADPGRYDFQVTVDGVLHTIQFVVDPDPFEGAQRLNANLIGSLSTAITIAKTSPGTTVVEFSGEWTVSTTLKVPSRVSLEGVNTGVSGQTGAVLKAAAGLSGSVVETDNITDGVGDWWHHGRLVNFRVDCSAITSGTAPGVKVYRMGEMSTVDRVMVTSARGHNFHFYGDATPLRIGYLSAHLAGRSGAGSGVYLADSIGTANHIDYIGGDDNATALLEINSLSRAVVFLESFKCERGTASPGNPVAILVTNGNGGTVLIGNGRCHKGAAASAGDAIIKNVSTTGATCARIVVLGTIEYDTGDTWTYDYYEDKVGTIVSVPWNSWRGRSWYVNGNGLTLAPRDGDVALELVRLSTSTTPYLFAARSVADTVHRFRANVAGTLEWGAGGSSAVDTNLYRAAADILGTDDNFAVKLAGKGLQVKEGTNAKQGVATLVAGTVTVSTTAVTANSRILLTVQSLGTVTVPVAIAVTARTAATSFTITSADATDTSVVGYLIMEPA